MRDERVAIVTAAGASSRMGSHKALLPWRGVPLVAHQVRCLGAAGFDPFVVTGARGEAVDAATPAEAEVVHNDDWQKGRSRSIEVGAAALPDSADAILVVAVDQPLTRNVLRRLTEHRDDSLVQPVDGDGRPGHPVVIGGAHLAALRDIREEPEGLRSLVRRLRPDGTLVWVENLRHWDLNDREAYGRARSIAGE